MKIGIATCADKPNLTVGDRKFASLLEKKGAQTIPVIWNEPHIQPNIFSGDVDALDAIILRSTWDYHRHSNQFLNWLSQIEKSSIRLINSPEIVRWNLDKSYLLEMESQNFSIVPSLIVKRELSQSQIVEKIKATGWKNLVLKPTISATAFLTFNLESSNAEIPDFISKIQKHSDLIVQPFIPSILSKGEVSLIFFKDQHPLYSHSVLKRSQSHDFRVQSDFGGTVEVFQPSHRLLSFATKCVEAIKGDWIFARVDIVDWEQEPLLSEIELIEPDLFLTFDSHAAQKLADIVAKNLRL